MILSIVIQLAMFASHSTSALKCYELVDSKCTLVTCGGSCYFGNATVNRQLINKEAKCWNSIEKDSCIPEWRDFDAKFDCFCNKDKCNSMYCGDSKDDHEDSSSKSTRSNEFPSSESGSPTNYYSTTTLGNATSATSSSSSTSSASSSVTQVSTSTTTESSTSDSGTTVNPDDDYEPNPRTSTTTGSYTTHKSGSPIALASVSSLTITSVIILLFVRLW